MIAHPTPFPPFFKLYFADFQKKKKKKNPPFVSENFGGCDPSEMLLTTYLQQQTNKQNDFDLDLAKSRKKITPPALFTFEEKKGSKALWDTQGAVIPENACLACWTERNAVRQHRIPGSFTAGTSTRHS